MSVPSSTVHKLPWWTWIVGLLLLHAGSYISAQFIIGSGISAIYLPTAIGIVLVNWWGPLRTLPLVYLSAVLSSYAWDVEHIRDWFLFSIPETFMVFLSWYLFTHKAKGKYWLPNITNLLLFLILGIIVPIIPELLMLHGVFVLTGQNSPENFWFDFLRNCLGEFTSSFGIATVILYYGSPLAERLSFTRYRYQISIKRIGLTHWQWAEIILMASLLLVSVFYIDFRKYWFFYGVFSLFVAIRGGFGIAILVNLYIYLITYILPSVFARFGQVDLRQDKELVYIFLGIGVLYVFAAVTGRVFSDLVGTESKLRGRNRELETVNKELDRFVYSVSHDLSAPLKSILGLVNIGKTDIQDPASAQYFTKIEKSVWMMETFIGEVLDYSRSKRMEILRELLSIKVITQEIIDNLQFNEGIERVAFDVSGIREVELVSDRTRIKIILNNLLSNAIKYQKTTPGHQSVIKIDSYKKDGVFTIEIHDNGEGIRPEVLPRIFDMFYRGHEKSKGSGLGLYIAREATEKINASLTVKSTWGAGSVFTLAIHSV